MSEFLDMQGYGGYIWSAYALAVGSLILNVWFARRQLSSARAEARRKLAMMEKQS